MCVCVRGVRGTGVGVRAAAGQLPPAHHHPAPAPPVAAHDGLRAPLPRPLPASVHRH